MSLIFATQLTAVATLALALLAIVTAWYARRAFLKQSQEVSDQARELQQVAAERTREAAERRRDQASRVFVWTEIFTPKDGPAATPEGFVKAISAHVTNTSLQPIYEVTVTFPERYGPERRPDYVTVLMPGEQRDFTRNLPPNTLPLYARPLSAILVEFRDRNQVRWRTRPDGKLEEVEPGTETPDPLSEQRS